MELAALALPAHPAALGGIPASLAVEEQEPGASARCLAVPRVEPVDGRLRRGEEVVVAGRVLGRGVEPVGQQGEPQVALAIAQVVDLEATDVGLDLLLVREEHRHHDERAHRRRHPGVEVERRKRLGTQRLGDEPVQERDRQVGRRAEGEDRHDDSARGDASVPEDEERDGEEQRRDDRQRQQIASRGGLHKGPFQAARHGHMDVKRTLQAGSAVSDQVVAGLATSSGGRRFDVVAHRCRGGHLHRRARDFDLGQARTTSDLLDRVAIAIARREVHLTERTSHAQHVVDEADALDELSPVEP